MPSIFPKPDSRPGIKLAPTLVERCCKAFPAATHTASVRLAIDAGLNLPAILKMLERALDALDKPAAARLKAQDAITKQLTTEWLRSRQNGVAR